jgi:hypothetical protein
MMLLMLAVPPHCGAQTIAQGSNDPQGEVLVNRLRSELNAGDWSAALGTRREILALDPPEGIVLLIDAWFAAFARDRSRSPQAGAGDAYKGGVSADAAKGAQGRMQFFAGHDSNPYAGPSASQIRIQGAWGDQILALMPSSLPQPGAVFGVRADLAIPSQNAFAGDALLWHGGAHLSHKTSASERSSGLEGSVYTGVSGRNPPDACIAGLRCGFGATIGAGQLRDVDYIFAAARSSVAVAGGRLSLVTSGLGLRGRFDSHRVGLEWAVAGPSASQLPRFEAGISRDWAKAPRAGGDQWRARVAGRWSSLERLAVEGHCERIEDDEPLARDFFALLRRHQTVCVLGLASRLGSVAEWRFGWFANVRRSISNAELYKASGSRLELLLERALGH